jgi:hypothetical protein
VDNDQRTDVSNQSPADVFGCADYKRLVDHAARLLQAYVDQSIALSNAQIDVEIAQLELERHRRQHSCLLEMPSWVM